MRRVPTRCTARSESAGHRSAGSGVSACRSPTSWERPDGRGRFNHFEQGSIYWTPETGAHDVRGPIRDKWEELGWETGFLGYPTSDQRKHGDVLSNEFEGGSIVWSAANGVDVRERIDEN